MYSVMVYWSWLYLMLLSIYAVDKDNRPKVETQYLIRSVNTLQEKKIQIMLEKLGIKAPLKC